MGMGVTRREQWVLIGIVALIVGAFAFGGWRRFHPDAPVLNVPGQGRWKKVSEFQANGSAAPPAPAGATVQTTASAAGESTGLDLNLASAEELERLPGIGPAKACAILETRQRLAGFQSVEQLDAVPGIGRKTVERLRPFVMVHAAAPPTTATRPAAPPLQAVPSPSLKATPAPSPTSEPIIDINAATEAELETLPGVGPVLARRIVEERRRNGPFRSPRDLLRVQGIGPRNLDKMLPRLVAGPAIGGQSPILH